MSPKEVEVERPIRNMSRLGIPIPGKLGSVQRDHRLCHGTMIDDLVISMVLNLYITRLMIRPIHLIRDKKAKIDLDRCQQLRPFHLYPSPIENLLLLPDHGQTSPMAISTVDTIVPAPDLEHSIRNIPTTNNPRQLLRSWNPPIQPPCSHGYIVPILRLYLRQQIRGVCRRIRERTVSDPSRGCHSEDRWLLLWPRHPRCRIGDIKVSFRPLDERSSCLST